MMFKWDFAWQILPTLLHAFLISLQAALGGYVLAVFVALVWTLLKRSSNPLVRSITAFVTEFLRSTPLLVQLYVLYYAGPEFGLRLSPLWTGVIGLGLHYSTYLSEVYRAALNAVPAGQWEAATSLNFPVFTAWRRLIIPQAIPLALPAMANYWIAMLKDTPIVSAITLLEVLHTAKIIGSNTFRYIEPITIVGILFLITSLLASALARAIEDKVRIQY